MRTLLVVDDSRLARMVVVKMVAASRPHWTVVEANSAAGALEAAADATFDGALLDFNMPGPDGLALAVDLRSGAPGMPIAMLSANHQKEVIARASAIGALFLTKPLSAAALEGFVALVEAAD